MERNVPKLRFKGFNDEWHKKSLREISTYINRTENNNVNITDILTISAGKGFMNQKDRFSQVIAGNSLKKYTLLYRNEFSYNRGNSKKYTYGCIYKLDNYEKALVPNVYISFKINNQVDDFYKQLFIKKYLDKYLRRLISSSTRMDGLLNINKEDFFDIEVPVPMIEEQEKIANFLTKVDKIIEKQDEKVKNLENYKKGMMQKIFSQEIRFKDENGNEYPEWEEKKLKDVVSGFEYGMNSSAIEFDGINKYIRITDIDESSNKYRNENIVSPDGILEDKYLVKENDILFARTGASVGKTYLYDKNDGKVYFAGFLIRANVNRNNNSKFIFMQTQTDEYKRWVKIMSMRSGQPGINSQEYATYNINIPCIEEQNRIAKFLTNIDDIIEKENKKLIQMRYLKKGLLQQMFV